MSYKSPLILGLVFILSYPIYSNAQTSVGSLTTIKACETALPIPQFKTLTSSIRILPPGLYNFSNPLRAKTQMRQPLLIYIIDCVANAVYFCDSPSQSLLVPRPVPLVFNAEQLPFFCKFEYKLMKNHAIPFKFRLGDVQYEEEMEGKK
jgi:hypothetical protein